MDRRDVRKLLRSRFVLFSCEGTAEGAVMQRLYDEDALVVPRERVVVDPMMYGAWQKACRRDRQLRPSEFCKGQLGLAKVKEAVFLRDCWDAHDLTAAIKSYDEHRSRKDGELSLGDLIA